MRISDIESVQFNNCTDNYGNKRTNYRRIKNETLQIDCRNRFYRWGYHARLSYRTIHPMWKIRMQMCEWSRTWPQILSIGKYARQKAGTALCSSKISGFNQGISIQLSGPEECDRRNKQYQSRNTTQERGIVKDTNGYHHRPIRCQRFRYFRDDSKQYASIIYRRICRNKSKGGF